MRVLWIGAHPDDELFAAPYLGRLIEERAAQCHFLVATRGERGACHRPEGCDDLAAVREEEMQAAAAVFGGRAEFGGCRDGSAPTAEQVLTMWAAEAGGLPELEERFRGAIERFDPDLILTFDARNGCTGHPDHRAIGQLVSNLRLECRVRQVQSKISWKPPFRVVPAEAGAERLDCSDWWDYLLRDLACHRSQMVPAMIGRFRDAAPDQQVVYLS